MIDIGAGSNIASVIGWDMNNALQVIGERGLHDNAAGNHFIWSPDTGMRTLQDLVDPSRLFVVAAVHAINDHGQIVVRGFADGIGFPKTFILDPVTPNPLPITLDLCASADFNNDGAHDQDDDIDAFFLCLSGHCCPACRSADTNADGAHGQDDDIASFFLVLGGGDCV